MATIDERLDKLTERHEALILTVELQGHNIDALTSKLDTLGSRVDDVMTIIDKLLQIATAHERRIDRLEQR